APGVTSRAAVVSGAASAQRVCLRHCLNIPILFRSVAVTGACFARRITSRDQQQWAASTWVSPPVVKLPTPQTSVAEVVATPPSWLTSPGLGLGTSFQAVPFQRRISVSWVVLVLRVPTAQALPAEVAATESSLLLGAGLGLATSFQVWPSQCSIRVLSVLPVLYAPTAQASLAEVAATAFRPISANGPAGFGLGTCAHFVPFQCSISVFGP